MCAGVCKAGGNGCNNSMQLRRKYVLVCAKQKERCAGICNLGGIATILYAI
jgi:hypothetical protein